MFEIWLLRSFVAVAESGGLTRAAKRLNSTQSTVSAQISTIGGGGGRPLFVRNTRSVQLTAAGEALLGYARTILRLNDDARLRLSGVRHAGRVRVGVREDLTGSWLTKVLPDGSGGFGMLADLRPANAGRGRVGHQDLSCSRLCDLGNLLHAPPLGRDEKQGALAGAAEHAREAAAVKVDRLQYMTAFADADAPFVGDIAVPDRVIGIEADAVGDAVAEVGPHTPRRQTSVRADVEGSEPLPVRLGNNQCGGVGRDGHAIGEGDAIRYLSHEAVGADEREGKAKRGSEGDLAPATVIDRDDFLGTPVREPQTVLVPPRRFPHREAGQQGLHLSS
jgi:DNA-binding transcriptional LysR family regulator